MQVLHSETMCHPRLYKHPMPFMLWLGPWVELRSPLGL